MDFYSIIALVIRLVLAQKFWRKGKFALKAQTRTIDNSFMLVSAASLLLGLFVYPFTTLLLIVLAVRIWKNYERKMLKSRDLILFLLTLIIFLKGPGGISLDKLLGNV